MPDPAHSPDVPDGVLDASALLLVDHFTVQAVTGYGTAGGPTPRVAVTLTGVSNADGSPVTVTALLDPARVCDLADHIEAAAIATLPGRSA